MSYRLVRSICVLVALALPAAASARPNKKKPGAPAASAEVAQAARALAGADLDAASKAAAALGADRSQAGLDALLDALALGLHPQVAAAALDALAARKKPIALDTLVAYAEHRNPKVRASALGALAALDDKRVDKYLLAALHDGHVAVRAAAAAAVAQRKLKAGVEPLMALLVKGDEAAAVALAALGDPALAHDVAESIGRAPDALVARCLGGMLARPDFKPEGARVEVVQALGRIDGEEALEQLKSYVARLPANPPRPSRKEAQILIDARRGGGK
jgi:HEAT repeat protein